MRRAVPPVLLCLLLALACDKEDPGTGRAGVAKVNPDSPPPKPPPLPTTGSPQIREAREGLVEQIEKAEKDLESGTKPAPNLLYGWKQLIGNLLIAGEKAVEEEAAQTAKNDLSALRDKQGQIDKARNELTQSIQQLQQYLAEIEAGGKPPEGFTEDELKDRLGTRLEEARALEKEETELRARMQEKERLAAQGKVPPQGPTVHTQELEALKQLKARIDKLEERLK